MDIISYALNKKQIDKLYEENMVLRSRLGLFDDATVWGVSIDLEKGVCSRIQDPHDPEPYNFGFDDVSMFGGRKRCNVADDGTINAWYGDSGYTEDGSNGQVMVYQPKFYYLVSPIEYKCNYDANIYSLTKVNYYVTYESILGFQLHPAFYDETGKEIEYFLMGAYEAGLQLESGAFESSPSNTSSITSNTQLVSRIGVEPVRTLVPYYYEDIAHNRGSSWHNNLIKQQMAEMLLMIIETATINPSSIIGPGVVGTSADYGSCALTGSTTSLGNGTGRAKATSIQKDNDIKVYTDPSHTSITWRGKENPWGNLLEGPSDVEYKNNEGWVRILVDGSTTFVTRFSPESEADVFLGSLSYYYPKADWGFFPCDLSSSPGVGSTLVSYFSDVGAIYFGSFLGMGSGYGPFSFMGIYDPIFCSGARLMFLPLADSEVHKSSFEAWKRHF